MTNEINIPQRDKPEGKKQIFLPIPTWHWGAPEDLVGSLIFLSLKASDYVLWAFLPINGGFLALIQIRHLPIAR